MATTAPLVAVFGSILMQNVFLVSAANLVPGTSRQVQMLSVKE